MVTIVTQTLQQHASFVTVTLGFNSRLQRRCIAATGMVSLVLNGRMNSSKSSAGMSMTRSNCSPVNAL